MSTIAKVFIVLNFVLSIFFVGVASTLLYKADNFKAKFEQEQALHKKEVDEKNADIAKIRGELSTAETSVRSVTTQKDEFQRDNAGLKGTNSDLETKQSQLQNTVDEFSKSLKNLESTIKSLKDENEGLKKSSDEASVAKNDAANKQAEAEAEVVRKEDALKDRDEQITALKTQLTDASEKIKTFELQMEMLKSKGIEGTSLVAPPPINGVVQKVEPALRIVILSVGADDGVKPGFPFDVFRGGDYIGRVVVDEVFADNSSARISALNKGRQVQAGDQATTRL